MTCLVQKRPGQSSTDATCCVLNLEAHGVGPFDRLAALEEDYAGMAEMLFGKPPSFKSNLEVVQELEEKLIGAAKEDAANSQ